MPQTNSCFFSHRHLSNILLFCLICLCPARICAFSTPYFDMEGVTPKEDHLQLIDERKSMFAWLPTDIWKSLCYHLWDGLVLAIQNSDLQEQCCGYSHLFFREHLAIAINLLNILLPSLDSQLHLFAYVAQICRRVYHVSLLEGLTTIKA